MLLIHFSIFLVFLRLLVRFHISLGLCKAFFCYGCFADRGELVGYVCYLLRYVLCYFRILFSYCCVGIVCHFFTLLVLFWWSFLLRWCFVHYCVLVICGFLLYVWFFFGFLSDDYLSLFFLFPLWVFCFVLPFVFWVGFGGFVGCVWFVCFSFLFGVCVFFCFWLVGFFFCFVVWWFLFGVCWVFLLLVWAKFWCFVFVLGVLLFGLCVCWGGVVLFWWCFSFWWCLLWFFCCWVVC